MNLVKNYAFLLLLAAVLSQSCSREDYSSSDATGKLSFGDIGVNTGVVDAVVASRSGESTNSRPMVEDDIKNGFNISVYQNGYIDEVNDSLLEYRCTDYGKYESDSKGIELRAGKYQLVTILGDNKLEGFDVPVCYSDTTAVLIKKGEETIADINCKVNSALLKINCSDNFKAYFSSYTFSVSTSLGNKVEYATDEVRPAYLAPGEVTVYVTAQKEGGNQATFNVGKYKLYSSYEYSLTLDVDAFAAKMMVTFNTHATETDLITIDVSDAAFNATAPRITSETLESGKQVEVIEGAKVENPFAVSVNAEGMMAACELATTSEYLTSKGWPGNIDLMSATSEDINKVKELGLDFKGLGKDAGQMAYIDFTKVITSLPVGNPIEITMKVTDKLGKVSEQPFVVSAQTISNDFNVSATAEEAPFLGHECKVNVSLKDGDPNQATFALEDGSTLQILKVEEGEQTEGRKNYVVTLKAGDDVKFIDPFKVKGTYLTHESVTENINVSYGIMLDDGEADMWAKRAVLHLYNSETDGITIKKQENNSGSWTTVDAASIEVSGTDLIVKGLAADTPHKFIAVKTGKEPTNIVEGTTEAELQVPNAGFEKWHSKEVWYKTIFLSGGERIYSFYPWSETETDKWWSTLNDKTTQEQSGVASWYYCAYPGTMPTNSNNMNTASWHWNNHGGLNLSQGAHDGNTAMEIATVGYGANNWTNNSHSTTYTERGELFIGTFDRNKQEKTLGHAFSSRPNKVKFYYKFYSYNNETTKAYAKIYDADKVEIGGGELSITKQEDAYVEGMINVEYTNDKSKAAYITIMFMSTDAESPSTKDIQGSKGAINAGYGDSRHIGSILTIDDVQLIYE